MHTAARPRSRVAACAEAACPPTGTKTTNRMGERYRLSGGLKLPSIRFLSPHSPHGALETWGEKVAAARAPAAPPFDKDRTGSSR